MGGKQRRRRGCETVGTRRRGGHISERLFSSSNPRDLGEYTCRRWNETVIVGHVSDDLVLVMTLIVGHVSDGLVRESARGTEPVTSISVMTSSHHQIGEA